MRIRRIRDLLKVNRFTYSRVRETDLCFYLNALHAFIHGLSPALFFATAHSPPDRRVIVDFEVPSSMITCGPEIGSAVSPAANSDALSTPPETFHLFLLRRREPGRRTGEQRENRLVALHHRSREALGKVAEVDLGEVFAVDLGKFERGFPARGECRVRPGTLYW